MQKLGAVVCALIIGCGGGSKKPTTTTTANNNPAPTPSPAAEPSAPTPEAKPAPAAPKSLYERLGKTDAITAVVNEFVARTTQNELIKDRFFNVDADNLKKLLVEFVCLATG